jgi:hypothetical protein
MHIAVDPIAQFGAQNGLRDEKESYLNGSMHLLTYLALNVT